jgi:biotin-[acetyl-CoA-carboxylase] ligase BirA-like protein
MSNSAELQQVANQVLDRCSSTNDLAKKLGEAGYPQATWVSARLQDQGRGRLGRTWVSLPGNLFLSYVARISEPSLLTWIPLTSAVALAKAIHRLYPAADIQIKWPNDVWLGGKKLAGILCEGIAAKQNSFLVIGVGVNCGELPADLDQPAATLKSMQDTDMIADQLRPLLISELTAGLLLLQRSGGGIEEIRSTYSKLALFQPGIQVEWTRATDPDKLIHSARVLGLGVSGELRVITEDAEEHSLWAEDVRVRRS